MSSSCEHLYRHLETQRLKDSKFTKDKQLIGTNYIRLDRFYCQKCLDIQEIRKEEYVGMYNLIPEWART